ncbi:hypothetical protein [Desulfovirgula thermocuniculi]|uniref:hypothetical protein n=1 Tax=Desulfovirgula thermocuniculi TaxID=348842 RepID=UPI00040C4C6D|nr:hypothetical protein [Desulfovirgula thermocuniculi]
MRLPREGKTWKGGVVVVRKKKVLALFALLAFALSFVLPVQAAHAITLTGSAVLNVIDDTPPAPATRFVACGAAGGHGEGR